MVDIDDFKKVNDVFGHAVGDEVLAELADHLRATRPRRRRRLPDRRRGVRRDRPRQPRRSSTIALATRLAERLDGVELGLAGRIAVSIGIAQGPEHAANPRELVACAEAAMMTAKARGKNRVVFFDDEDTERPAGGHTRGEDIRSIAHLKMLQSLAGKLNRSNDVREIGMAIANELRQLIDYHNCRVFIREGAGPAADRIPGRADRARPDGGAGLPHARRRGADRPRGRDRRAAPARRRVDVRVRGRDPRHREDRGVDHRRPAALRLPRHRRDRRLQARPEAVRRGRPAPARRCSPAMRPSRSRTPASTRRSAARRRARRRCSSSGATSPPRRGSSACSNASSRARHS